MLVLCRTDLDQISDTRRTEEGEKMKPDIKELQESCHIYKRRWLMLLLFCLCSMTNASHWIQYSIITDIVVKYYYVTPMIVNWTSMVFMAVYIPLVFPATWVLEKKGLRVALIIGTVMMTFGSWLKVLTVPRDRFSMAFIAQFIIGSAQIFTLSVPARLAALWFGNDEVSTACAFGVFGNQVGIALSFLIPPAVVHDSGDMVQTGKEFCYLHYGTAIATTVLLVFILCFFEEAPLKPPSIAQANIRDGNIIKLTYLGSMKEIFRNKDFGLLTLSYGANVGVFYAYSTLLNQLFLIHFPDGHEDAGKVGLALIFGGMIGAVAWGYILDRTHKFKSTTMFVYFIAVIGMLGFSFSLYYEALIMVYITSAFLGFFMNGYLPVAYQFAAQLTYPMAESTSSGILNAVGEFVGVILVLGAGFIIDELKDLPTNLTLSAMLGIGFILCLPISKNNLRMFASYTANTPD